MSKKTGERRYGDPRKRKPLAGDLARIVQPTGASDPRTLGGDMSGPDGSRDRGAVVLDTTDCVLMDHVDVCAVDRVRGSVNDGPAMFMTLDGRINNRTERARVGYLFGPDGAAAIITELLALADRFGAELLDDLTRRLIKLHQGQHVDLAFLRAAIDNAMEVDHG